MKVCTPLVPIEKHSSKCAFCLSMGKDPTQGYTSEIDKINEIYEDLHILSTNGRRQFLEGLVDLLSPQELSETAHKIGQTQKDAVYNDCSNISQKYKDPEYLARFDINQWIQDLNSVAISFVCGISGINNLNLTTKFLIGRTVEQFYKLRMEKLILPLSFLQSIYIYGITDSRAAIDILAKSGPSGSYTSILNWMPCD